MLVDMNYVLKLGVFREERDIQSPIQEVLTQLISLTPVFGMSFSEESRTEQELVAKGFKWPGAYCFSSRQRTLTNHFYLQSYDI